MSGPSPSGRIFCCSTAVRQEAALPACGTFCCRTWRTTTSSALNPSCPDIAVRVENYIEAHYRNCGLTVQSIAGELGFTNSYLCAAYKKVLRQSGQPAINMEVRLHHAKELLAGTEPQALRDSRRRGLRGRKIFCQAVHPEVGLSPREYRGRHSYSRMVSRGGCKRLHLSGGTPAQQAALNRFPAHRSSRWGCFPSMPIFA